MCSIMLHDFLQASFLAVCMLLCMHCVLFCFDLFCHLRSFCVISVRGGRRGERERESVVLLTEYMQLNVFLCFKNTV